MRGLFALSPGTMAMPFSPPFSAASRVARLNRLLGRSVPWQRRQEVSRMGLMSAAKSIVLAAGGGSFETSTSAAKVLIEKRISTHVQNPPGPCAALDFGLWTSDLMLIPQQPIDIRSMHRRMAAGGPAS